LERVHFICRIDIHEYFTGDSGSAHKRCSRHFDNYSSGDVMKIRIALTTFFALMVLAALPAAHASVGFHSPVHAMFGGNGQKSVKINLRNDTGAPLELKIGDKVATLQAGQVVGEKLPVGTRITTNTATANHKVGDVIVEITTGMYSDSTLSIK
jgi:hypothetical protein